MLKFKQKDKYPHIINISHHIMQYNNGGIKMSNLNRKNNKGVKKMKPLTAKCNKAFVVSPEQSKKFLEHKCNRKTNEAILEKISTKIKDANDKV